MKRLELVFVAFCLATWFVSLLAVGGFVDLADRVPLTLRQLYIIAAALGWVFGNVFVQRSRGLSRALQRRFWVLYFFGPPGFLYLLRLMGARRALDEDPARLVPLLAFFVYVALFMVPVVLRSREPERPTLRIGRSDNGPDER